MRYRNYTATFYITLTILLLTGCDKLTDDYNSPKLGKYYIELKANGSQQKYEISPEGYINYLDSLVGTKIYNLAMGGVSKDIEMFTFGVFDIKKITNGTFRITDLANGWISKCYFIYGVKSGKKYYKSATIGFDDNFVKNNMIEITSISEREVKGTFSGMVYRVNDSAVTGNDDELLINDAISITEGKFYLPIKINK